MNLARYAKSAISARRVASGTGDKVNVYAGWSTPIESARPSLSVAIISAVSLVSLVIWELFTDKPIIDVRLFKNFNYLGSNVMMFTLGILLFSSLVMMPQFLQTQLGYTAELAGLVLSGGAVVSLLSFVLDQR